MTAVKQVELVPVTDRELDAAPAQVVSPLLELAKDPAVDVVKLERLIAMQERAQENQARGAFMAAFADMQGELPEIDEQGRIKVDDVVRSRYARNEDIQAAIRPVLKKHGFALSFRERTAEGGKLEIVGILSHKGGHCEEDRFITAPDDGGKMNTIQRRGSARSYGQRYVTIFLLNIVTREKQHGSDDDGQGSERPDAPEGFEAFVKTLQAEAVAGTPALMAVWNRGPVPLRNFIVKHHASDWNDMKAVAAKAGKK